MAGRPNHTIAAIDGLIPVWKIENSHLHLVTRNSQEPQDSVDLILERFADAGNRLLSCEETVILIGTSCVTGNFSAFEVISLLASHSVARADKVGGQSRSNFSI